MSTPYEHGGRSDQKRRTREALVTAARSLVTQGAAPTVEAVAAAAAISRTTAYRYFPSQHALLAAAHPETVAGSMLDADAPKDPAARLDAVIVKFLQLITDTEPQQRTMLRLSLEADPAGRGALPLRQGRAIGWFTEALEPLRGRLSEPAMHQLVLAIRSAVGIEALVWLTDIGGLSRSDAVALMRWTAQSLLAAATKTPPPRQVRVG
jgi:AcrR family transcriptional regulator